MQKRIFTLVLVVIVGILLGLAVVKKQAREPLLREILQKQQVLLQAQTRMEAKIEGQGSVPAPKGVNVVEKLNNLEGRIGALETQLKGLLAQANQGGNNAAAVRQGPPPEDLNKVYDIPVAQSPIKGSKKAPVTIVEFVDFQCPFCARFHQPVVDVMKAYPKDVRYILKNFPLSFHPQARPAAKAALAAGEQGKYYEMADLILENNRSLSDETFEKLAGEIGLNVKKFMNDYKNKDQEWEKIIRADMDLGREVNVRGTPTFYLNGKKTKARDLNSFKQEIDEILSGKK